MSVYAVYDTNVIVSALLSRNANAATVKVLDAPQYTDCCNASGNGEPIATNGCIGVIVIFLSVIPN